MFRHWRRKSSVILMLLMMLTLLPLDLLTKKVYAAESMKIGDYVQFGQYLGKPILWRVINIDSDGSPMLWSEKILCLKPFDAAESGNSRKTGENPYTTDPKRQGYGSNKWENSNIREWLNSSDTKVNYTTQAPTNEAVFDTSNDYADESGFLSNFSQNEMNIIKPVTHKSILANMDKEEKTGGFESHSWYEPYGGVKFYSPKDISKLCHASLAKGSDPCVNLPSTSIALNESLVQFLV